MEKRKHTVSLSFILLRFGFTMMASMFTCCILWYAFISYVESRGIVYSGYVPNKQVQEMIAENSNTFEKPDDNFLADYALFDKAENLISSNVKGKKLKILLEESEKNSINTLQHTYIDESYIICGWHFRKEFANPKLRKILPPFEYIWWVTLGLACILCWLVNAILLRRKLVEKLKLFKDVSEKVGAQKLDFEIPHAGIKEFDKALDAMEDMRHTLYCSLSSQWAAQQQRDSEMVALAHDLKTPITLIGGNAELLLEEDLQENHRKLVENILSSNSRVKQYVSNLMETFHGEDEVFENTNLKDFFDNVCQNAMVLAQSRKILLHNINDLSGYVSIQKEHLCRAMGNIIQNAIEYTSEGGNVLVEGDMTDDGWQVTVKDEGIGFSKTALIHATERLWREDSSRETNGHNGLGLWFASQVIKNHNGQIVLSNSDYGGVVVIRFKHRKSQI